MGNLRKIKILTALVIMFTLACSTIAKATPETDGGNTLDVLNEQNKNNQNQFDALREDVEKTDNKLSILTIKLDDTNNEIDDTKKNLEEQEKLLDEYQNTLYDRLRESYKSGNGVIDYLEFIMNSKSLSDLIGNCHSVETLVDSDKLLVDKSEKAKSEIESKSRELEKLKKSLNHDKDELDALKDNQDKQLAKLKSIMQVTQESITKEELNLVSSVESLIDNSNSVDALKSLIATLNQINSRVKSKEAIDKIQECRNIINAKINGVSSGVIPPTNNKIIIEAYKYLGIPYLWGGNVPSTGMDCSGFVKYVYGQLGYNLTRTTYTQVNEGTEIKVNLESLKSGDLIFFGDKSAPHHVAIYIGNNYYIHAPQTGDVIKVSLGATNACTARRIVNG